MAPNTNSGRTQAAPRAASSRPTAVLVLSDGSVFKGRGFGAAVTNVGEVCFNTSMTGYQEIMTDPSYAGQIITFTFPHIGNVGANGKDHETGAPSALGMITRQLPTAPANWRSESSLEAWMVAHDLPGIAGVDTRALTRRIRDAGAPTGVICHNPDGVFDIDALAAQARDWPGLAGMDLAIEVTRDAEAAWDEGSWDFLSATHLATDAAHRVVAMDFGCKDNILRCLTDAGCDVTVVPAETKADTILAMKPDGVFLSNGPGDPAATGEYAVPMIRSILDDTELPIFGICLGHQILARALGGKTVKMNHGHHGANHPVKEIETGKVEITSMNHGFAVDGQSLPSGVIETHVSLFDGSNCGIRMTDRPVFSVQHHPEASPGPQDSFYLFERFVAAM